MTNQSDETFLDEMARLAQASVQETADWLVHPDVGDEAADRFREACEPEAVLRLVALARRAPALTWQPMETAPKDGTAILILIPMDADEPREIAEVKWDADGWQHMTSAWKLVSPEPVAWIPIPSHAPAPPEARP